MKSRIRFFSLCTTILFSLLLLLYYIFLSNLPGGKNFGVTMVGILNFVFFLSSLAIWQWRNPSIPKIVWQAFRTITCLFCLWFFSFLMMIGFIFYHMNTSEVDNPDYLLILGAGLNGAQPSLTLQERLKTGLDYLNQHPELQVIVSGGQGPGETISEAEAMGIYLIDHGISQNRILYESQSTSTMENFVFSSHKLKELGIRQPVRIMIVTSDFHLLRAKMLAERNSFIPGGLPAPTPYYLMPTNLLREYCAFGKSLIFDRI